MQIKNKTLKALRTSVACTFVAAIIMVVFQTYTSNKVEIELANKLLSEIPTQLDAETQSRKAQIQELDRSFQVDLSTIKYVMETDGAEAFFDKIRNESSFSSTLYLVGRNGVITHAVDEALVGKKLTDVCPLSTEEYNLIIKSKQPTNTAVHKESDGTLTKVFATSFADKRIVAPAVLKGKYASIYSLDNLSGLFGVADERLFVTYINNSTCTFGVFNTSSGDLSGQPISAINLDNSVTQQPTTGKSEGLGYTYHYKTIQYQSDIFGEITLLALYVDADAVPVMLLVILLATILLLTFLLQLYCLYIDEDECKLQLRVRGFRPIGKNGWVIDMEKARILIPFSLVCIVVLTLASFYLNSLNMVANQAWTSRWNIEQVASGLNKVDKTSSDNLDAETEGIAEFLRITAAVLQDHQHSILANHQSSIANHQSNIRRIIDANGVERVIEINNPWLAELASVEEATDISVFNNKGQLLSTSGTQRNISFSRLNEAHAPLFEVLDGINGSCLFQDGDHYIVVAPFVLFKNNEHQDALLVSRFTTDKLTASSQRKYIANAFDAASESGQCHYIMTTTDDEHRVIYAAKALNYPISFTLLPAAFQNDYVGFQKVQAERYFVATKLVQGKHGEYYIISFVPLKQVYLGRLENTLSAFGVTLLSILVLLSLLLIYTPKKTQEIQALAQQELDQRKAMTPVELEKADVARAKAPSASQRILGTIHKVWIGILCLMTLSLITGLTASPSESLAAYLLTFLWQKGINVFAITTMLMIALSFSFIIYILTKLMSVLSSALNANAETVCQLVVSLLHYGGYIVVVFVTLYMFGVDTTGVLASLGAFSVMVGLGAKDLITNLLSGIMIISAQDYKVGDIVNIGGFCGKVTKIGIRATYVEDIDGNVKIFNNSSVSGVINKTRQLSAVRYEVTIDAQHSFKQIEEALNKFFDCIEGKYPQIKGDCKYLGVQSSSSSSNTFCFTVPCDEIDRVPLRRALTQELSEFCKEEKINKQ